MTKDDYFVSAARHLTRYAYHCELRRSKLISVSKLEVTARSTKRCETAYTCRGLLRWSFRPESESSRLTNVSKFLLYEDSNHHIPAA